MSLIANLSWAAYLPTGWHELYRETVTAIHDIDPALNVRDAKQKFGELRIYLDYYDPQASDVIKASIAQSKEMCEECGAAAQLMHTATGYYATLCPAHSEGFLPATCAPMVSVHLVIKDDGPDKR